MLGTGISPASSALLALTVLILAPCMSALICQKTETGYQPHKRDCGPFAKGCRVMIKPYKVQNNSAVGPCRTDERPGDYIYDCAVECKAGNNNGDYWNEVLCCSDSEACNSNLDPVNEKNNCYVSKHQSQEDDRLEICTDKQRCARNVQTQDTQCVEEAECKTGAWICCSSTKNCNNQWGVYKPENAVQEEEALDSHYVKASVTLSAICALCVHLLVTSW